MRLELIVPGSVIVQISAINSLPSRSGTSYSTIRTGRATSANRHKPNCQTRHHVRGQLHGAAVADTPIETDKPRDLASITALCDQKQGTTCANADSGASRAIIVTTSVDVLTRRGRSHQVARQRCHCQEGRGFP